MLRKTHRGREKCDCKLPGYSRSIDAKRTRISRSLLLDSPKAALSATGRALRQCVNLIRSFDDDGLDNPFSVECV
jgi:hypothetical protein